MKPRQILYCPKCELLLKNPVYSRVERPCCTEYGRMISYVIERDHVLKSSHDELLEAAKGVLKYYDQHKMNEGFAAYLGRLEKAISKASE